MTPLHVVGDWLREAFGAVPLPAVRAVFAAIPAVLLVWVLRLPRELTISPDSGGRWDTNLKTWAAVALLFQVAIYCLLG